MDLIVISNRRIVSIHGRQDDKMNQLNGFDHVCFVEIGQKQSLFLAVWETLSFWYMIMGPNKFRILHIRKLHVNRYVPLHTHTKQQIHTHYGLPISNFLGQYPFSFADIFALSSWIKHDLKASTIIGVIKLI